jgi:hypothetical protein
MMHFFIFIYLLFNHIISLSEYAQIKENQVTSNDYITLKPNKIVFIHLYHYYYYFDTNFGLYNNFGCNPTQTNKP